MIDNEPAAQMSVTEWDRHMAQTVLIEVHEPRLHLSQGSWLRASRRNVNATLMTLFSSSPGDVRVTVSDGLRAADLRREALAQKRRLP